MSVSGCIEKFVTVNTELGMQAHKETLSDFVFPGGCLEVFLLLLKIDKNMVLICGGVG